MRRALTLLAAAAIAAAAGFSAHAATAALESAAELRASGFVGEQYDGYLGFVRPAPPQIRSQVEAVNIRRRAHYTGLASRRGAQVEEVGAAAACEILASRIMPGQYYLLQDGVWRQRGPGERVARPAYCTAGS